MFMIVGSFAIVAFMLIIGFIGEVIGSMFSSSQELENSVNCEITSTNPAVV